MKKFFSVFVCVLMACIALAASFLPTKTAVFCENNDATCESAMHENGISGRDWIDDGVSIENDGFDAINALELPLVTIESLADYEQYIAQRYESSNFVTYEMVQEIGTFVCFVCFPEVTIGNHEGYIYTLRDESGQLIYVNIEPFREFEQESSNIATSNVVEDDLRVCVSLENGYLKHNDMQFFYVAGELFHISWQQNDLRFTLYGDGTLADYSTESDTFVSKLILGEQIQLELSALQD